MQLPGYLGVDIGGTKIAVVRGNASGVPQESVTFPSGPPEKSLPQIMRELQKFGADETSVIGVACGDPLDRIKGEILSPPNLPGWDKVEMVHALEAEFLCKAYLMNDANAGALAEWKFGAGEQSNHMVFVTAGTGFGAGLMINGLLVEGASGSAGEIGHVRLAADGPVGYGKAGSVEGFCSGGGIAQLAQAVASANDGAVSFNRKKIENITTEDVAKAAQKGDEKALQLFRDVGYRYGEALAILVDILNPEKIVLGSIFVRCRNLLEPAMREVLEREALSRSAAICEIVPAQLDEEIGNYAALAVAWYRNRGNSLHPRMGEK
ncbi:MAG: ROK family protein [Verrucomicrobiota bacterium]